MGMSIGGITSVLSASELSDGIISFQLESNVNKEKIESLINKEIGHHLEVNARFNSIQSQRMNETYHFDRFFYFPTNQLSEEELNALVKKLESSSLVNRIQYIEEQKHRTHNPRNTVLPKSINLENKQYYKYSTSPVNNFKIGGVNANAAKGTAWRRWRERYRHVC